MPRQKQFEQWSWGERHSEVKEEATPALLRAHVAIFRGTDIADNALWNSLPAKKTSS